LQRSSQKKSSTKFAARLVTAHRAGPIGRLTPMAEEGRPTGITYVDAKEAIQYGGSVDFEGRKVQVVHFSDKQQLGELHTARLVLDLGDERLGLEGYFSGDEFMETGRRHLD
jgi:hypothetical protein